MWKFFTILRPLFWKKKKPAKWESIGSPSYRKAIRELGIGCVPKIRRKAWGDDRYLYIRSPNTHVYGDMTDGQWPDAALYPPRGAIRHVTKTAHWGQEFWQVPDDDIQADDWQVQRFGIWETAPDCSFGESPVKLRGWVALPVRWVTPVRDALKIAFLIFAVVFWAVPWLYVIQPVWRRFAGLWRPSAH
jgi:hypothetical protein